MSHHAKDKGDLGVAKAIADLTEQGFMILLPMTEHAPFDLVAYRDGACHRVQVKYRAAVDGVLKVQFVSTWADRNGTHKRPVDKSEIDVICIYCPDTNECYYVSPHELRESVVLRLTPSRNNQRVGIRLASAFREMPVAASA